MKHYESERVTVHQGDCLDVLRELPDASVDAVVTDPPYGLEFMGKDWDRFGGDGRQRGDSSFTQGDRRHGLVRHGVGGSYGGDGQKAMRAFQQWCEQWAAECLRVLKPGGHMLAFGGTRTWHRLACAIEDAGFEMRDNLAWLYGSGFPKSLDVSKAIDKAAGAEREVVGVGGKSGKVRGSMAGDFAGKWEATAPATPDAARWQGWGTALKPAYEPIVLARKPLSGTVAGNVLAHGTGALNVDATRISTGEDLNGGAYSGDKRRRGEYTSTDTADGAVPMSRLNRGIGEYVAPAGRWPANVVLDSVAAAMLDEQSGERIGSASASPGNESGLPASGVPFVGGRITSTYTDSGGASRFFYTAKADSSERPRARRNGGGDTATTIGAGMVEQKPPSGEYIAHPTVKPLDLMRWLVRLVTPPGGVVLEPFAGSGATVEACILEGFRCVAIEREPDYLPLIMQRIHRRVDPVAHHEATRTDDAEPSLFDLLGGDAA